MINFPEILKDFEYIILETINNDEWKTLNGHIKIKAFTKTHFVEVDICPELFSDTEADVTEYLTERFAAKIKNIEA